MRKRTHSDASQLKKTKGCRRKSDKNPNPQGRIRSAAGATAAMDRERDLQARFRWAQSKSRERVSEVGRERGKVGEQTSRHGRNPKAESVLAVIFLITAFVLLTKSPDQFKLFLLRARVMMAMPLSTKVKPRRQREEQRAEVSKLPSNPEEVEDLRRDSAANPLVAFSFNEIKLITENFRKSSILGVGGFGSVYRGFITEHPEMGLQPLQVAVKVHDAGNGYQGHTEWLVLNSIHTSHK
ncbi:hypothetical protein BHM03_00007947 [Ensete ventricosum]|nr:hypothetical protein BHM03_00007947 [Ensete ventricosum]